MNVRVHIYSTMAQGRGRVLVLRSAAFSPEEGHGYSFYKRLSELQDQCGHEGVNKNLPPSDTRNRTQAVQPVPKRLAAELPGPLFFTFVAETVLHSLLHTVDIFL